MAASSLDALKDLRRGKKREKKKEKNGDVTANYIWQKGDRKVKDWDDEILGSEFVFGGQNNIDFNFTSYYYWLFFQGFNLVI